MQIMKEKQMGCFGRLFQVRKRHPPAVAPEKEQSPKRLSFDIYIRDVPCFEETSNTSPRQLPTHVKGRGKDVGAASKLSRFNLRRLLFSNPCSFSSKPLGHNAKQYPSASSCRFGRVLTNPPPPPPPPPPPSAVLLGGDKMKITSASWSQGTNKKQKKKSMSNNPRENWGGFLLPDSGTTFIRPVFSENPRNSGEDLKETNAENAKAGEKKREWRHVYEAAGFSPSALLKRKLEGSVPAT